MAKDEEYRALLNRSVGIVEVSGPDAGWVDDTLDHLLEQLGGEEPEPSMGELEESAEEEPEQEEPEPEEEEEKPKPRRSRARQSKPEEEEEPKPRRSRARQPKS